MRTFTTAETTPLRYIYGLHVFETT